MMRTLLTCVLAVCSLFAQDEAKAVGAFQKAFKVVVRKDKDQDPTYPIEDRTAALAGLAGLDSAKVAEALANGWLGIDEEIGAIETERAALTQELDALYGPPNAEGHRVIQSSNKPRIEELKPRIPALRLQADDLRSVQLGVAQRIAEVRRKDALLWLLSKIVPGKKGGMGLRIAVGRALGAGAADILPELGTAMARSREPEEQLTLLEAMAAAGRAAQLHATPVIALLQSKEEAVRERAAQALAKIAVPEAVGPIVQALMASTGQAQARIATALEILTGQPFGLNLASWQSWLQAEGKSVAAGEKPLGQGTPSKPKDENRAYYFGIPQDQCNGILYLIDCSDSMKAEVSLKLPAGKGATVAAGADGNANKTTRIEACKAELVRALGRLQPRQKFAVIWYNDQPHWWQTKMLEATKDNVEAAQAFVRTLKHASSTNIHDSLEQGFTLVGRGARDKYYGMNLDTIFLLTDGSPTKPDGKPDSTDKILEGVRAWNPVKRVTIHTIGIGNALNEGFLRTLAEDNGGEFKKF
jgi:hypothetical protein